MYIHFLNLRADSSVSPTFFFVALCIVFTLPLLGFTVIKATTFIHKRIPSQWNVRIHKDHGTSQHLSENVSLRDNQTPRRDNVMSTDVECRINYFIQVTMAMKFQVNNKLNKHCYIISRI